MRKTGAFAKLNLNKSDVLPVRGNHINFTKAEFEANNFKYNKKHNFWALTKTNGWNETLNILAILSDAYDDVRPSADDYVICVQMGENDMVAFVAVEFYNDEIYHKILTFIMDNGEKVLETSSGKLIRYQASYNGFNLELDMDQHIVSRTSSRTIDPRAVKSVDESYNEYTFVIYTGIEAQSKYLDKQAKKKDKRKEQGRKLDLDDMM